MATCLRLCDKLNLSPFYFVKLKIDDSLFSTFPLVIECILSCIQLNDKEAIMHPCGTHDSFCIVQEPGGIACFITYLGSVIKLQF